MREVGRMLVGGDMQGQGEAMRARFLAPGTRIGRYTIVRRLASGGMAELYLARVERCAASRSSSRSSASCRSSPRIPSSSRCSSTRRGSPRRSITPTSCTCSTSVESAASHFFAMEYVHGEDLRSRRAPRRDAAVACRSSCALAIVVGRRRGPAPRARAAAARRQPARASCIATSRRRTCIVTYDGAVKVVDFGIAQAPVRTSKATRPASLKGKVRLHVARAVPRRARRSPQRRVRARHPPVRAHRRSAAVHRPSTTTRR